MAELSEELRLGHGQAHDHLYGYMGERVHKQIQQSGVDLISAYYFGIRATVPLIGRMQIMLQKSFMNRSLMR